jgi:hypothetical protein
MKNRFLRFGITADVTVLKSFGLLFSIWLPFKFREYKKETKMLLNGLLIIKIKILLYEVDFSNN